MENILSIYPAKIHSFALFHRYKQQLALAAERECILEQNKVQAEHDWQQLCENAESDQCQKSEDLTQRLSSAGEQVRIPSEHCLGTISCTESCGIFPAWCFSGEA